MRIGAHDARAVGETHALEHRLCAIPGHGPSRVFVA